MPLGDSRTQGIGDETNQGGYRGPLYQINQRLQPVGLNTDPVSLLPKEHHQGTGGFTSQQIIDNLATYLAAAPNLDAVLLDIDTNDVGISADQSGINVASIVASIVAARPLCKIFVAKNYGIDGNPNQYDAWSAAALSHLSSAYGTPDAVTGAFSGNRNVIWVTFPTISGGTTNWAPSPPGNLLHLNHHGYETYIAPTWAAYLAMNGMGP